MFRSERIQETLLALKNKNFSPGILKDARKWMALENPNYTESIFIKELEQIKETNEFRKITPKNEKALTKNSRRDKRVTKQNS